MGDIPKYNATVHPEEWVRQVQAICLLGSLRQEKDVLKMCKLNIALSITFPNEINTLNELIKALKAHPTYDIYKNGCKQKLDKKTFEGGEGGDTAKFLAEFRTLCDHAEITNPQEIKNRLIRTYSPNEFFKNEFARRITNVTDIDEIYKIYSDVVADSSKVIKYGPEWLIALKHRETGRYLSSREVNYQTGSKRQVVYAGEKVLNDNSWWYLTCETPIPHKKPFQENKVMYDDVVYLTHNKTKTTISVSEFYRSPKTTNAEVNCFPYSYTTLRLVKSDETNEQNKTPYFKTRDIIYLRTAETDYILRSKNVTFDVEENPDAGDNTKGEKEKDKNIKVHTLQEVAGHKERVGRDDEWFVERK